jgi:hypothetical protein
MNRIITVMLFAYSIQAGYAQDSLYNISKGTWVVESNKNSPRNQLVKFYNSRLELVYEERVTNKKIRYEKARIKKALDKTLDIALRNEKDTDPGTLATVLRSKRQ